MVPAELWHHGQLFQAVLEDRAVLHAYNVNKIDINHLLKLFGSLWLGLGYSELKQTCYCVLEITKGIGGSHLTAFGSK